MKTDIPRGLAFAARFLPRAWRGAWLSVVLGVAVVAYALHALAPGAGAVLILIWVAAAQSALYPLASARLAGAGERATIAGRAADSTRLAAVIALIALLLAVVGLIVLVALLAAAFGVASAGAGFKPSDPGSWAAAIDARGRGILGVVAGLCAGGVAWVLVRVSFAAAATVAEGRVRVLSSWPLTRGAVLPIVAARTAVNAFPVALLWAVAHFTPDSARIIASLAAGVVVSAFMLPLNVGLMSYLYRHRPGPE